MKTTVSKIVFFVCVFCLLLVFNSKLHAQSSTCENYINKANDIYSSNPDSSYHYANLALECATKENDSLQLANANSQIGRYHLLKSDLKLSEKHLNTAQHIYLSLSYKKGLAQVYKLKSILQKITTAAELI